MRIRTRLYWGAFFVMSLVAVLVGLTVSLSRKSDAEIQNSRAAGDLVKKVTELVIVTDEYLAYQYSRNARQWQAKYEEIVGMKPEGNASLFGAIEQDLQSLHTAFLALKGNLEKRRQWIQTGGSKHALERTDIVRERLTGRMRLYCNNILSGAFHVSRNALANLEAIHKTSNRTLMVCAIVLIVMVAASSWFTIRRITTPLGRLMRGAETIEKGDLNHHIEVLNLTPRGRPKDEIGDLSLSFNRMTEMLIGSVDELKHEVSVRKQAEESLQQARDELELRVEERTAELVKVNRELKEEIGERRRAEEALREAELWLKSIFNSLEEAVLVVTPDRRLVDVNKAAKRMFGYSQEELSELSTEVLHVDHEHYLEFGRQIQEAFGQGKPATFEFQAKRKNGSIFPTDHTVSLLKDERGESLGIVSVIRDNTERKEAQDALQKAHDELEQRVEERTTELSKVNERLKQEIEEHKQTQEETERLARFPSENPNPVIRVRKDGTILYANEASALLLSAWGCRTKQPIPEKWRKFTLDVFNAGFSKDAEVDCHDRTYSLTFAPVEDAGYVNIYGRDITEHKKAEEKVKASLKEKEVLLREIHHRVKNNMQVITSLLKLQSAYVKDKQYVDIFRESQRRIKSMALIHEKLYRSGDLAHIDFDGYVKALGRTLFRSYGVHPDRIALQIEVADAPLGLDKAVPCGLIINELVSNSLKYAFPQDRKGQIAIGLHPINEEELEMTVRDNGIGMPKDLDFRNTESLGLHLVTMLAEDQLEGEIELHRDRGTQYSIRFKSKNIGRG